MWLTCNLRRFQYENYSVVGVIVCWSIFFASGLTLTRPGRWKSPGFGTVQISLVLIKISVFMPTHGVEVILFGFSWDDE